MGQGPGQPGQGHGWVLARMQHGAGASGFFHASWVLSHLLCAFLGSTAPRAPGLHSCLLHSPSSILYAVLALLLVLFLQSPSWIEVQENIASSNRKSQIRRLRVKPVISSHPIPSYPTSDTKRSRASLAVLTIAVTTMPRAHDSCHSRLLLA